MEQRSMTALVSAFSRAYHSQNNEVAIFNDSAAKKLLTDEEYNQISRTMSEGIGFFNPTFAGKPEEALRWIVDHQLSPLPLGRAAFAEESLEQAVSMGAKQYLIFGAGYDTFAYRQPHWADRLVIFEIDQPATAGDKRERLKNARIVIPENVRYVEADFTKEAWQKALANDEMFDRSKISCCTMLGVVYYLSKQTFEAFISALSSILPKGSQVIFDYPDEINCTDQAGERAKKQSMLAGAAKEAMLAGYSYPEMEQLLSNYGFQIHRHLMPREMTEQYFDAYNKANPSHQMSAFDHVNYCLGVKA